MILHHLKAAKNLYKTLRIIKKKKFFGSPKAVFENTNINKYLIEQNSIIEGLDTIIYSSDIESKLYGNIYGRESE